MDGSCDVLSRKIWYQNRGAGNGTAINCLFLATYIYFAKSGLRVSLLSSFLLWSLLSLSLVLVGFNNYPVSLISYAILLPISYYLVQYNFGVKSVSGIKIVYTINMILLRGMLGGLTVTFAAVGAKLGGPKIGGMFSTFSAMFTSAVLSAISVVLYSMVVRYSYLNIGIIEGTLVSLAASFAIGCLIYNYLIKRSS